MDSWWISDEEDEEEDSSNEQTAFQLTFPFFYRRFKKLHTFVKKASGLMTLTWFGLSIKFGMDFTSDQINEFEKSGILETGEDESACVDISKTSFVIRSWNQGEIDIACSLSKIEMKKFCSFLKRILAKGKPWRGFQEQPDEVLILD